MLINTYPDSEKGIMNSSYIVRSVIFQLYGISYFVAIKLYIRNVKLKSRNQQLSLEKKTSELHFLKSQTNPHFLFNTLNNIYALARNRSELTAGSVMRLSDILRYMLYETQSDLVTISKEIEIIEDYIELEKMRYDDSLQVIFETDIDDSNQEIPPLLLINLTENAFKHGISETIHLPFIKIQLTVHDGKLLFTIENSAEEKSTTDDVIENIGLANLRRQLGLLFTEYQLNIERTRHIFWICMNINLKSYAKN